MRLPETRTVVVISHLEQSSQWRFLIDNLDITETPRFRATKPTDFHEELLKVAGSDITFVVTPPLTKACFVAELIRQIMLWLINAIPKGRPMVLLYIGGGEKLFQVSYACHLAGLGERLKTFCAEDGEQLTPQRKADLHNLVVDSEQYINPELGEVPKVKVYIPDQTPQVDWRITIMWSAFSQHGFNVETENDSQDCLQFKIEDRQPRPENRDYDNQSNYYLNVITQVSARMGTWQTRTEECRVFELPLLMTQLHAKAMMFKKAQTETLPNSKEDFDDAMLECFLMAGVELPAYRGGDVRQEILDYLTKELPDKHAREWYTYYVEGMAIELHGLAWALRTWTTHHILVASARTHYDQWGRISFFLGGNYQEKDTDQDKSNPTTLEKYIRLANAFGRGHKTLFDRITKVSINKARDWYARRAFCAVAAVVSRRQTDLGLCGVLCDLSHQKSSLIDLIRRLRDAKRSPYYV